MTRGPGKQFDPEVALARAMEVFWAHGYEGASLSQLLQHMGINKKSLYDTYGNKRSLFLKTLDHYNQTVIRGIRDRLLSPGSSLTHLEEFLQELVKIHGQAGSHGCMLGTNLADFDTNDPDMAAILRGHLHQLEDVYRLAIGRAQAAGELNPDLDPKAWARLLLCVHQGMVLIGRVVDQPSFLDSPAKTLTALLKHASIRQT